MASKCLEGKNYQLVMVCTLDMSRYLEVVQIYYGIAKYMCDILEVFTCEFNYLNWIHVQQRRSANSGLIILFQTLSTLMSYLVFFITLSILHLRLQYM